MGAPCEGAAHPEKRERTSNYGCHSYRKAELWRSRRRQNRLRCNGGSYSSTARQHHGRLGRRRCAGSRTRAAGDTVRDARRYIKQAERRNQPLRRPEPLHPPRAKKVFCRRSCATPTSSSRPPRAAPGRARASPTRMLWELNPKLVIVHCLRLSARMRRPRSRQARLPTTAPSWPLRRHHHARTAPRSSRCCTVTLRRRLHQLLRCIDRALCAGGPLRKADRSPVKGETIDLGHVRGACMAIEPVLPGRLPQRRHQVAPSPAPATRTSAASACTSARTASSGV